MVSLGPGTPPLRLLLFWPLLLKAFSSAWRDSEMLKTKSSLQRTFHREWEVKEIQKLLYARWDTIHPLRKQEPECFVFTWGTKSHLQNKAQKAQSPTRILWGHSLNDFPQEMDFKAAWHSTHLHHYHHHSDYCYCYYYHYFL